MKKAGRLTGSIREEREFFFFLNGIPVGSDFRGRFARKTFLENADFHIHIVVVDLHVTMQKIVLNLVVKRNQFLVFLLVF